MHDQRLCTCGREVVGVRMDDQLSCSTHCPANSYPVSQPTFCCHFPSVKSQLGSPSGASKNKAPFPRNKARLPGNLALSPRLQMLLLPPRIGLFNPNYFLFSRKLTKTLLMSPPAAHCPSVALFPLHIFTVVSKWEGRKYVDPLNSLN